MIQIGINGFGRIGKIIFLQLIEKNAPVVAINIPDFSIENLETYLKYDTTHHYDTSWELNILNDHQFTINGKTIDVLNSRDAKQLNWGEYGVNYLIDATGVFLTEEKAKEHDVDYFIMCAPSKDNTPSFIMYGNHEKYDGERIVNNASCTSNAIIPILKVLNDKYTIQDANFITIHSTTASQQTVDTVKFKNRTSRSIFNNIIPHTTGASKSISKILPELDGKVHGTSVRVPTSNVSMIDLNVQLKKDCELDDVLNHFKQYPFIQVDDNKYKISCDYNTTTCACIIDQKACMKMQKNQFKISIWYDNEWSYANKVVLLMNHMIQYNNEQSKTYEKHYFIEEKQIKDQGVVLRVDWNVPIQDGVIQDYFRIDSTIKTLKYIVNHDPKYLLIVSHLGRPNGHDDKLSFSKYLKVINKRLKKHIKRDINLIETGLTTKTQKNLSTSEFGSIFLLDNIRFHKEECKRNDDFDKISDIYLRLGDLYINDAFACCHRDHLSITAPLSVNWGYGYLIHKETKCLADITQSVNNERVLAIMGGAKMDDKLPLLETLSKEVDGIYIAGGNVNSILKNKKYSDYINSIQNNRAKIYIMIDGLSSDSLKGTPKYEMVGDLSEDNYFFDIGMQSIVHLTNLIDEYDTVFWNGSLGVVEDDLYKHGSTTLVNTLIHKNKKVIIGGGDTACFVNKFSHNFYYVSTGGGASIDFIANKTLVGLPFSV